MLDLLELLRNPFVLKALVAVLYISLISATIGSLMVYRGESFLLVGSAHAAMAGAALAMVVWAFLSVSVNPLLMATLFSLIVVMPYIAVRRRRSVQEVESFLGYLFATLVALAVLFISMLREYASQAWGLIVGDIMLLTVEDIVLLTALTAVALLIVVLFIRELLYVSFDPEGAEMISPHSAVFEVLYGIAVALAVVVLLKSVGALLIYVMLIAPPTFASRVSKSAYGAMQISFVTALAAGVLGIIAGAALNLAPSALMAVFVSIPYAVSAVRRR